VSSRAHVDALTGIRGIAAWLVVFYHIRSAFTPSMPGWVIAIASKGYLAVDLFFVLSGFVLWMTWEARLTTERWHAVSGFLRKRIARVWPLHAVILTATIALALILVATGRPLPAHFRWGELPLHYLLIQNWGFTSHLAWNDPSWSISTELAAYVAFALLVPAAGQLKMASPTASLIRPIAAATVLIVLLDRFFAFQNESTLGANIPYFGLARCLAEFGCGVAMCMVWQRSDGPVLRGTAAAVFIGSLALWLSSIARETLMIPLAFAALVPFIASTSARPRNPLSSRIAVFLGEISYSTYLAHFLLWTLFKIAFVRNAADVPLLLGGLYMMITLAVSILLYRFVEVPARRKFS
jgi:peptidoglycan/LPS O-acetylase OafA/YrhL